MVYEFICRQCDNNVEKKTTEFNKIYYDCKSCGYVNFVCIIRRKKE